MDPWLCWKNETHCPRVDNTDRLWLLFQGLWLTLLQCSVFAPAILRTLHFRWKMSWQPFVHSNCYFFLQALDGATLVQVQTNSSSENHCNFSVLVIQSISAYFSRIHFHSIRTKLEPRDWCLYTSGNLLALTRRTCFICFSCQHESTTLLGIWSARHWLTWGH